MNTTNSSNDDLVATLQERIRELEKERSSNKSVIKHLETQYFSLRSQHEASSNKTINSQKISNVQSSASKFFNDVLILNGNESGKRNLYAQSLFNDSCTSNELQQEIDEKSQQVIDLKNSLEAEKQQSNQEVERLCKIVNELRLENDLMKAQIAEFNNSDNQQSSQSGELLQQKINDMESAIVQSQHEKTVAEGELEQTVENVDFLTKQNLTLQRQIGSGKGDVKLSDELKENQRLNDQIDEASKKFNKRVEFLEREGKYFHQLKHYEEAIEFYIKAISVEENGRNNVKWLATLWNNVSVCWAELLMSKDVLSERVPKAAEKAIEKAASYNSDDPSVYFSRGSMYFIKGLRYKAISEMKRVIALDPDYKNAKDMLVKFEST